MQSDFRESLRIRQNTKRTRNIDKKMGKHMKVLIGADEISRRVQVMAEQIAKDYKNKPLALICVEFGGRDFYNLLIDNLHSLGITDFFQGSVKVGRGASKASGERITSIFHFESGILCDKNKLKNMHLLIVDDQISSGKSFDLLKSRYGDALSVELATLIVKSMAQKRLRDIKYYSFFIKSRC